MNLEDIKFEKRIAFEAHPRYGGIRHLLGLRDFSAYREVFERGCAETSIMAGELTRLEYLPLDSEAPAANYLAHLMGINEHAPRRLLLAKDFFDQYEKTDRREFLKHVAGRTAYVKSLIEIEDARANNRNGIRRIVDRTRRIYLIRHRISTFLNIYENMKKHGTLVGEAHDLHHSIVPLRAADVPWAIDYGGYLKLRDGAHRRAAASALGWTMIPTLVFEFDKISDSVLAATHLYIRENFAWFSTLVRLVAQASPIRSPIDEERGPRT